MLLYTLYTRTIKNHGREGDIVKKCEKCLHDYDDTWGVCLFCGDKLKREEECRKVCELEGKTPEEVSSGISTEKAFVIAVITVFILAFLVIVFIFSKDIWTGLIERLIYQPSVKS